MQRKLSSNLAKKRSIFPQSQCGIKGEKWSVMPPGGWCSDELCFPKNIYTISVNSF